MKKQQIRLLNSSLLCFCEQFTQVLFSSNIHPKCWIPYLKQQCQKVSRAFDIICSFELTIASCLSRTTTSDELFTLYDECIKLLCIQRGIPKEQQIRNLLATYYAMRQNPSESVSNFAHRFMETQHSLQKLVPGIHSTPDDSQAELIHAFCIKLKPDIGKYLLSREKPFKDLLAAIESTKRQESVIPSTTAEIATQQKVLYTAPSADQQLIQKSVAVKNKGLNFETAFCRNFNRFVPSHCELPQKINVRMAISISVPSVSPLIVGP